MRPQAPKGARSGSLAPVAREGEWASALPHGIPDTMKSVCTPARPGEKVDLLFTVEGRNIALLAVRLFSITCPLSLGSRYDGSGRGHLTCRLSVSRPLARPRHHQGRCALSLGRVWMKMVTDESPSKGASSTSRSSLVDGCAAIKGARNQNGTGLIHIR